METSVETLQLIKQPIKAELERFAEIFDATLQHDEPAIDMIFRQIKQRKGKQMRPTLLILVARAFGKPTDVTYLAALMLELLHTASLIHDDIVDESDERRGHASINALYGNKIAVLVGDYLLSTSLQCASRTRNMRIIDHISRLGRELSSGEILQLLNTQRNEFSIDTYFDIIKLKTATLFQSTAELGALSVDASDEVVERMMRFGQSLGLCFQIRDDIFDYTADQATIGKPIGNDMREGKLTLPVLLALNNGAPEDMCAIARRVRKGEATDEEIARLVAFTKQSGGLEAADLRMRELADEARAQIKGVADNDIRLALERFIDFVVERAS